MNTTQKRRERGSMMIEFVLVSSFFLVPLIIGTFTYGFAIIRSVEAVQLTRDIGHMYSRGVDFSVANNQALFAQSSSSQSIANLGQGMNIVANPNGNVTGGSSGYGVVVLTTLTYLNSGSCTNCGGHVVVMNRVVIGNNSLFTTAYGSPATINPNGDVPNYQTDTTARADAFTNLMTLNNGEIAYLAESYVTAPDLAVPGVFGGLATYQDAIF
jgi:hypothetical protein